MGDRVVRRRDARGHDHSRVGAGRIRGGIAAGVSQSGDIQRRRGFAIDEAAVGNPVVSAGIGLRYKLGVGVSGNG